jgi:hypothetical protein
MSSTSLAQEKEKEQSRAETDKFLKETYVNLLKEGKSKVRTVVRPFD